LPSSPVLSAPHIRATESTRGIYLVTAAAAMAPLLAGMLFFGYRAILVAGLSITCCLALEGLYFRVTGAPAMLGRSHALLTGALLALTLPPFVPWYVPVIAAAFAVLVGKAIFGGVGHFLWQPALVGRLAVAVLFSSAMHQETWPVLAPGYLLTGDVNRCVTPAHYPSWRSAALPPGAHGFLLPPPDATLRKLTDTQGAHYSSLIGALVDLPPMQDMLLGAAPGAIGQTSILLLVTAGLYLIYRHYVWWLLPVSIIASAAAVAAMAPVNLLGPDGSGVMVWLPAASEGPLIGITYVNYHLAAGELELAAFFLATEMTSRPVTHRGQLLFGIGIGAVGMLLRLYTRVPLPFFLAVLVMNFCTPLLERFTRPRVVGMPAWWQRLTRTGLARRRAV
jgi:electron transport complex protein RnfD